MIEKWLQFTCDECEDVANSVEPNMTVRQFMADEGIVRRGTKTICRGCAGVRRERVMKGGE